MEEKKRPFTFTALNEDPYLEFTIKRYEDHHGVTDQLHQLTVDDELIIDDPWGAIEYKGPGYFIAGGAGITPFIAILRSLFKTNSLGDNQLFFSNKTRADIIYEHELTAMMGGNRKFILSQENNPCYLHGHIDEAFIHQYVKDFNKHFYVCGPDKMIADILRVLEKLGAKTDALIFEK